MKAAKDMIENKSTVPSPSLLFYFFPKPKQTLIFYSNTTGNLGVLMIDSKDIVLGKKIGSGSFGAVYKGDLAT